MYHSRSYDNNENNVQLRSNAVDLNEILSAENASWKEYYQE